MARKSASSLLTSLDDLFTTQEERDEAKLGHLKDIPLDEISDFPDHPFKVRMDEDMTDLADSIMPDEVRQQIYDVAATSDARVSATQDIPVFTTPPQVREPATPEVPAEDKAGAIPAPPPRRERVTFTALHPEIPAGQRRNFRITDPELGYGTPSEKYAANVAAIRTLKRIEAEERLATPEEQEVLSRYVGWGGLADCFDERHSKYQELKSLLNEDEYAAARASSLTAFYTSPVIIEAMYKALAQMGFQSGNILEPACGVGNFIGMIPEDMAGSHAYGVEIDSIWAAHRKWARAPTARIGL